MKIKFIALPILFLLQLLMLNPVLALELNTRDEYLFDVRGDDGDIYRSYITLNKKIDSYDIEMAAFLDSQWNLETDKWEKILFGAKLSKYFLEYFYAGQSIQLVSGEMLDYLSFEVDNKSFDTTTKIGLRLPFLENFCFDLFEEYSVNLEELRDEYCETVAEISYRPKEWLSISSGWRHTDRVHNLDTDYATASISFRF